MRSIAEPSPRHEINPDGEGPLIAINALCPVLNSVGKLLAFYECIVNSTDADGKTVAKLTKDGRGQKTSEALVRIFNIIIRKLDARLLLSDTYGVDLDGVRNAHIGAPMLKLISQENGIKEDVTKSMHVPYRSAVVFLQIQT